MEDGNLMSMSCEYELIGYDYLLSIKLKKFGLWGVELRDLSRAEQRMGRAEQELSLTIAKTRQ